MTFQRKDGSIIKVWPVLCCAEGDIPFLEKITNSIGHGGKRACFRCALNGIWHAVSRAVRYADRCCGTCSVSSSTLYYVVSDDTACVAYRWLGYHSPIEQQMPCHTCRPWRGQLLSAPEAAAVAGGAVPRLPPGYVEEDTQPVRAGWTENRALDPSTWAQGNELKYSANEIMARGETAAKIQDQVSLHHAHL